MKNGDKVVVQGSVSVYERDGRYQLYAREISLEGAGLLYEKYLALKQELEEMGMFAPEYKQPIPRFIKILGVVTAPTGAAIQDIRNISYRRNPYLQIVLYPALVQGDGAVRSIVRGIQMLDAYGVDVMIVGRGGGSIEDLWAFNEEEVARAIFNCETPIISAVGHETDTTIADFVADLRAPTPSAAAELAVCDYRSVEEGFREYEKKFQHSLERHLLLAKSRLRQYQIRLGYLSPENQILEKRQFLVELQERMESGMNRAILDSRLSLDLSIEKMKGLSPLDKLKQGYAYVVDEEGRNIKSSGQVKEGDILSIQLADGEILARAEKIRKVNRGKIDG